MNIEEQFNLIAQEYDCNRGKFIPCFEDYYKTSTEFIASNIVEPKRILDLGAGTGLLSYYWYKNFPNSDYILVDIADEMLKIANKRFLNLSNVSYEVLDYLKELPENEFDTIISALSIHHLEDKDKKKLFSNIYNKLPQNGLFVNYDQFCAGQSDVNDWYDEYWINHITNSGLKEKDIELWKERRKLDRECLVEEEVKMLEKCKFRVVKCVYTYQKFSVIVAIK